MSLLEYVKVTDNDQMWVCAVSVQQLADGGPNSEIGIEITRERSQISIPEYNQAAVSGESLL